MACFVSVQNVNAQTNTTDSPRVFTVVEQMPEFPGGETAVMSFLSKNIVYPEYEKEHDIQGRVIVEFVVNEDGSISNVIIKKSVSQNLDAEAMRVVKLLPKFKPGKQQGKVVRVSYILPIVFKLTDDTPTPELSKSDMDSIAKYRKMGDVKATYNKGSQYLDDSYYTLARAYLELAAEKHYPLALRRLGYIYQNGLGVSQDYEKAMKFFSEAADSGDSYAQMAKGYMYVMGWGVAVNKVTAAKWYQKSADQNNEIAMCNIAYFYMTGGDGLTKNDSLARMYYQRAADSGLARAESQLAYLYESGNCGMTIDTGKAYYWYIKAAEMDYPYALYRIGEYYLHGVGSLPQKDGMARAYISKAAKLGSSNAQFSLAYMYQYGEAGLDPDTAIAMDWYEKAAEQGSNDARNNYAWLCYLKKTNISKAIEYVKLSLEETPNSMNRLDTYASLLFLKGDYTEAEKNQKKALELGGNKKGGYLERYGDILMLLNKKDEAMKYWKMALEYKQYSNLLNEKIAQGKYIN
jgi:TonB family protein